MSSILRGASPPSCSSPGPLVYTTRYSFDRGNILETVYTVEYRHQCWSIAAAIRDRAGNVSFSFSFNLAGLTTSSTKQ